MAGAHLRLDRPNDITYAQLAAIIAKNAPRGSKLNAADVWTASQRTGYNALDLLVHAAHESAWGMSKIARTKNNFFGIGAYDSSPQASAYSYAGSVLEGLTKG